MNKMVQGTTKLGGLDLRLLVGGVAYYLLAKFGMALFSLQPSNITVLWLPSGIGLLLCLSAGNQALLAILLASFAANFAGMTQPAPAWHIFHVLVAASADTFAAWFAARMLRRHLPAGLTKPADLIPFTLFVCVLPSLASALLLTGNLVLGAYIPPAASGGLLLTLLVADSLGILLCYPLIDTWQRRQQLSAAEIRSWALITVLALAVVQLAFAGFPALVLLLTPLALYMVFNTHSAGVPLTLALAACLIVTNAAHGLGPFDLADPVQGRMLLVTFLFSTAITVIGIWLQEKQLCARQALIADQNGQLARAKEVAEAANVAKSLFLAKMGHEMRTPLHQILGLAQLLRKEPLSAKQDDWLGKLEATGRHMGELVDSVLDITRLDAGDLSLQQAPFAVAELLDAVAARFEESSARKGLCLTVEKSPDPLTVIGDRRLLGMALANYVSNAIRFTDRGSVSLRAEPVEEAAGSVLIRFEVRDTGIGIAADNLARLFSVFEQVDNSSTRQFGGLGVGLTMTRKLAGLMGGEAGCESRLGEGSTFWFSARLQKT